MKYYLIRLLTNAKGFIEIDEERFSAIKKSQNLLFEALYVEEKFDILIENYLELEQFTLKTSSEYLLSPYQDDKWYRKQKNTFNRLLINLLSTTRLYVDQSSHSINIIFNSEPGKQQAFKSIISDAYDQSFSYRLMDSLRNYIQHRSYPINSISYYMKSLGEDDDRELLYSFTAFIDPTDMFEDKKVKKSVKDELIKIGKKIDIKPYIREYLSCMGRIHLKLRELISDEILNADNLYIAAIDDYKQKFGPDITGLASAKKEEAGLYSEKVFISSEVIDHRKMFERKNRNFDYLSKQFVTGQIYKN